MTRRFLLPTVLFLACVVQNAVGQACSVTFSSLTFGTYSSTQLDGTATGRVTCSGGWTLGLNQGGGAGATVTNRLMTGPGSATLGYQLFTDSARTANWGNTTGNWLTGTGNTNITVYGRILANQYPTPGTYTDTVSSATASFTITAIVQARCMVTATDLAFGNYSGTLINATSTITATCTKTTAYNVGLNAGTATGATVTNRKMTGPSSSTLNYNLFRNTTRTLNWGNTVGTDTVAGTASGAAQALTVYGSIPAAQYVRPGSYSDTITVTLTY